MNHIANITHYKNDIMAKYKPITKTEQFELFELLRNSNSKKAYNAIYYSALKFVLSVANRYKNQGVEFDDLVQAGNLGLDRAIKDFNHKKDIKFISYAVNWIRSEIFKEIAKSSRFLKTNTSDNTKAFRVKRAIQKLEHELMRTPEPEEVSERTGISLTELEVMRTLQPQASLDSQVTNIDGFKLSDVLEDKSNLSPEEFALTSVGEKIVKFVDDSNINARDKEIVKMFHGVGKGASYNQVEIGEHMNMTGENARLRKEKGVKELRSYNVIQEANNKFHLTSDMLEQ